MSEYKNTEQNNLNQFQQEESLDIKAVLFRFLRYWYWFALTLVLALVGAYLFNKYAEPEYKASGTVLVTDDSQGNMLFNKGFRPFMSQVKLENEIAILSSYQMRLNAAREMNWQTTLIRQGQFRPNEVYENRPFFIEFDTNYVQPVNTKFHVTLQDLNQYRISFNGEFGVDLYDFREMKVVDNKKIDRFQKTIKFGQWYKTDFFSFRLVLNDNYGDFRDGSLASDDDTEFWFTFNSLINAAGQNGAYAIDRQGQEADILRVSKEGKNQNRAVAQVNALLEAYVKSNLEEKNQRSVNTIEFIDNQLEDLNDTMQRVEKRLQEFQSKNEILQLSDKATPIFEELNRLESQRVMESLKQNYYKFVENYIRESKQQNKTLVAPSTIGIEDEMLSNLVSGLNELYSQRSQMLITSTSEDPRVKALNKQIEQAEDALLENIGNIVQHSKITISNLDERIAEMRQKVSELAMKQRQLVNIRRKYKLND